ncbi:MAG: RNA polymerase sigma factor [Ignavibacteria bacterium]|nr:RNA polymerase sigma factor [Ignavibacteria bacterium]
MNINTFKKIRESDFGEKTIEHLDQLFTFALLITGDSRKAEKILQSTYEKAFGFYKYLSDETNIEVWLFRIMLNILQKLKDSEHLNDDLISDDKSLDTSILNAEDFEKEFFNNSSIVLTQLIASLSFKLKIILVMANVLKFNCELITDLIDLPLGTVKKRLFDARKILFVKSLPQSTGLKETEGFQINSEDKKFITTLIDENNSNEINDENRKYLIQEIESQRIIKQIIDENLKIEFLRSVIKFKIVKRYAPALKDKLRSEVSLEKRGLVVGATLAMIILIAVLIIIFKPAVVNPREFAEQQSGKDNIFIQLQNNYSLFNRELFNESLILGDADSLKALLSSPGSGNETILISLPGWNFKGFVLTEFKEHKLVNLFYENGNGKILYSYLVPLNLIEETFTFKLTRNLLEYLESGNCYSSRKANTIYLLKRSVNYILGFAMEKPESKLVIKICNQIKNNTFRN